MIRLLFVGDGERDAATNPHLVTTIIGAPVEPTTRGWFRLNEAGRGYDRKLLYAIIHASQDGLEGVVATVDRDRSPGRDRIRELQAARDGHRQRHPPVPTAVGVADPHAEAWLLDDPVAVRTALQLDPDCHIPSTRDTTSPKAEITRLHRESPRRDESARAVLVEIAQALELRRCQHDRQTGFAQFVDDVRREIGPLVTPDRRA